MPTGQFRKTNQQEELSPYQNPPYEYELQHVPSLPDKIYAIAPNEN